MFRLKNHTYAAAETHSKTGRRRQLDGAGKVESPLHRSYCILIGSKSIALLLGAPSGLSWASDPRLGSQSPLWVPFKTHRMNRFENDTLIL